MRSPGTPEIPPRFRIELEGLLNTYGVDNALEMHDIVLAQLLTRFLDCMLMAKLREERLSNG